MNTLSNIIIFFLVLIILFWLRFPNLYTDDYLYHKILLVICAVTFQIIYKVVEKIQKKCIINKHKLLLDGLNYGLMTLIGYSVYQDLVTMSSTREYIIGYGYGYHPIMAALIITIFVSFVEILKLLTNSEINTCSKKKELL